MAQRITDLVLSLIAGVVSVLLSWPFWRDYEYWAESHAMWWFYFALGFVLVVYVFYAFLESLHTLFAHDALLHEQAADSARNDVGDRP